MAEVEFEFGEDGSVQTSGTGNLLGRVRHLLGKGEVEEAAQLYFSCGVDLGGDLLAEFEVASSKMKRHIADMLMEADDCDRAGRCYEAIEEWELAAEAYEEAEKFSDAGRCRAQISGKKKKRRRGRQRAAASGAKKGEQLERSGDLMGAATAYVEGSEPMRAVRALQKVPEDSDDYLEAITLIAEILVAEGRKAEAIMVLSGALPEDGICRSEESAQLAYRMGVLLSETGASEKSQEAFKMASNIQPNAPLSKAAPVEASRRPAPPASRPPPPRAGSRARESDSAPPQAPIRAAQIVDSGAEPEPVRAQSQPPARPPRPSSRASVEVVGLSSIVVGHRNTPVPEVAAPRSSSAPGTRSAPGAVPPPKIVTGTADLPPPRAPSAAPSPGVAPSVPPARPHSSMRPPPSAAPPPASRAPSATADPFDPFASLDSALGLADEPGATEEAAVVNVASDPGVISGVIDLGDAVDTAQGTAAPSPAPVSDVKSTLAVMPAFDELAVSELADIAALFQPRQCAAADVIADGHHVMMIVCAEGVLQVARGRGVPPEEVPAGGFYGDRELLGDVDRMPAVRAKVDSTVFVLEQGDFVAHLTDHPGVGLRVYRALAKDLIRELGQKTS